MPPSDPPKIPRHEVRKFREALAFMRKNFRRGLTVRDIARMVGMNDCSFSSRFTRWHGRKAKRVLIELQIEEAKRLLRRGKRATRVAVAIGWTYSNLAVRFKRFTGVTASEWAAREKRRRKRRAS
jgi:AraC-like DNA-binding protein